jgi:hypothetical protein
VSTPPRLDDGERSPLALRIDAACNRFEKAWRAGPPPRIEDFLEGWQGAYRAALLRELVLLDLDYRRGRGEPGRADDYRERFPELDLDGLAAAVSSRPPGKETTSEAGPPQNAVATDGRDADHVEGAAGHSFGDYEVLEELGRGGMGVVYKARQVSLNRVVALKQILAGAHAGPADLTRFRAEAEAVARLQHPNIVQVFEVGEHQGRPFLSLEFCGGGNLAKKLNGTPLPPKEAARLVETLGRAVHAAHQRQVIHRDLKPANVLLTEEGAPKITDFGLAKKVDSAEGLTLSGVPMGTYSYMPPEQAEGKWKEVGPAADVYALGAILYECLTGRPPFKAATLKETLRQVVHDDPVSPRQLQPKTPCDLETICLKCLRKEPAKRYASALELAEDLRRFQDGKPIKARPVGAGERVVKWVRRQPVLAGITALFVASLLTGTGVSTYLAVLANNRADQIEKDAKAIKDEQEKTKHEQEKTKHEQGKTAAALKESEANLKGSQIRLVDGLLRSVGRNLDTVDPIEWQSLWELAALPKEDDPVRIFFIDRALDAPETAELLGRRSAMAVHAAVGLDRVRREQVLKVLRPRLRDREADGRIRTACILALAELTPLNEDDAGVAVQAVLDAMDRGTDPNELSALKQALGAVAPRMNGAAAAAAAQRILDATDKNPDQHRQNASRDLAQALAAVAPQLDRLGAEAAAPRVIDLIAKRLDQHLAQEMERQSLVRAWAAIAPRLDEAAAAAAAHRILDAKVKIPAPHRNHLLAAVAPRLEAAAAAAIAERLLDGMETPAKDANTVFAVRFFAQALATVAPRLDEAGAATVAQRILDAMGKNADPKAQAACARALPGIAPRISETAAKAATEMMLNAMEKPLDPDELCDLAEALAAVAPRLDEAEGNFKAATAGRGRGRWAAAAAAAAAQRILDAMEKNPDSTTFPTLAQAFAAVAPRLDRTEAAAAAQRIIDLKNPGPPDSISGQSRLRAFGAAASRMDGDAVAQKILDATDKNPRAFLYYAELAAVARRLDAAAAASIAMRLLDRLDTSVKDVYMRSAVPSLTQPLAAVAPQLDRAAAAAAAQRFFDAMDKDPEDKPYAPALALALAAAAPRLERAAAAAAAQRVIHAMTKTTSEKAQAALALALGAVAPRLDDAGVAVAASRFLIVIASNPNRPMTEDSLRVFQALGAQLDRQGRVDLLKHPACVGQARAVVLQQLGKESGREFNDVWELVDWLAEHHPEVDVLTPPQLLKP